MPIDPDVEKILKSREPKGETAKSAGAAAAPPPMDWQQSLGEGVAKTGANLLTGAASAIGAGAKQVGRLLPDEYHKRMDEFVDRDLSDPTFQRMQKFGRDPGSNWWSTAGSGLTDLALLAAGPGEAKLGAAVPTWTRQGWQAVRQAPSWLQRGAAAVKQGAYGGAVMDPQDPLKGAAAGAVAGPVVRGVGAAAGSAPGQFVLGHGSMGAIMAAGLHKLGAPLHEAIPMASSIQSALMWPMLHYRGSPVGRAINDWAMSLGEFVAKHAPKATIPAGAAAGEAARRLSPPRITVPRRATPEEPMMREPPPERKPERPEPKREEPRQPKDQARVPLKVTGAQ